MFIKRILKHIWPQIAKHKWAFFLTFLFYGLHVLFGAILENLYFKKIIDIISSPTVDRYTAVHALFVLVFINFIIRLGAYTTSRLGAYTMVYFQSNTMRELSDYIFGKIINNSYSFFSNRFVGSLVTKSRRFVRAFEAMHDTLVLNFWTTFLTLTGVLVVLFIEASFIAFVFLAWVFVYVFIISLFVKRNMRYDIAKAEADSRVGGRLADVFSNIFALKIFSSKEREKKSFSDITKNEQKHRDKSWYFKNKQDAMQSGLMVFVYTLVLYLIINLWAKGSMTTGTVVLIQLYMVIVFNKLWDLGKALTKFMESIADMNEVIDILETNQDIVDQENPEDLRIKSGNIEFKNVSFLYDSGQEIFKNFNLKINAGEKIGIVGYSGAGKSTITKLLLRFLDVSEGAIEIDGQDIRSVIQDELRKKISYVPQEPMLFHRTISENMSYGKPDANEDEIHFAAIRARAHEFITDLPYGYDTLVGERGVKLSGGERQRVAIARVMLADTPILILDEATSSLDSISESYIQDAFTELMKGKTTIVIAHRLSTIQKMDRIIVLHDGEIMEDGNHKELLARGGMYADLWNHQTGGFME